MTENEEDCGCEGSSQPKKKNALTRITENIFTTDEEKDARMEICQGCDYYDPILSRCMECGCFLEVKTRLKMFHCPLKPPKW